MAMFLGGISMMEGSYGDVFRGNFYDGGKLWRCF